MPHEQRVATAVYRAIDLLNQGLPEERQVAKSLDTSLFGGAGRLDSLSLVTLVVAIEDELAALLDVSVTIADERAMSQTNSPFRTVGSLVDYIHMIISESKNG